MKRRVRGRGDRFNWGGSVPKSILLVRLSARGDVVFATPLVRALKERFPDARVSWLVEPHTMDLVAHHPALDAVIVWPRREWRDLLIRGRWLELSRRILAFRRQLRGAKFDVALDLQGLLKSAVIAWASGAKTRIGVGSREMSHLFMSCVFSDHDLSRVSSQYLELAEFLGLPTAQFHMEVALSDDERAFAARAMEEHALEDGFAALIPFTTWPQKHWFEERWAELAERLRNELALVPVLFGGPEDHAAAARITEASDTVIVDMVGRTSLTEASALIERSSLLVGVDTGLNHIGIAFDRPTVSLFGANVPYFSTPTDRGAILRRPLPCSPCHRRPTCGGAFPCMKLITVDDVIQAAAGRLALQQIPDQGRVSLRGT